MCLVLGQGARLADAPTLIRGECMMAERHEAHVLAVCALLAVATTGGCAEKAAAPVVPIQRPAAQPSAVEKAQRDAAIAAAPPVLADVDACEAAVLHEAPVDTLTEVASRARKSTRAFAASDNGTALPEFTKSIVAAANAYYDSCTVWRKDEKAAIAALNSMRTPEKTDLDSYRHPVLYQTMWLTGAEHLGEARAILKDNPR